MAKIRLNLGSLTVAEKITKAQQIVTGMTGNPNFPTPSPPLTSITTAVTELSGADNDAQAARQAAKEKTSIKTQKEDALDRLLTQVAGYVESIAGDNEQMILSAGMDMRATGVATSDPPPQLQALAAAEGSHEGELDLTWDPVPSAKSYVIERSGDPVTPTSWVHSGVSTRASFTAEGLTSGSRYWFRVAGVNNNGRSGWSDPTTKIAP